MLQMRLKRGADGAYRFGVWDDTAQEFVLWSTQVNGYETPGEAAAAAGDLAYKLYVDRAEVYTEDGLLWS